MKTLELYSEKDFIIDDNGRYGPIKIEGPEEFQYLKIDHFYHPYKKDYSLELCKKNSRVVEIFISEINKKTIDLINLKPRKYRSDNKGNVIFFIEENEIGKRFIKIDKRFVKYTTQNKLEDLLDG